MNTCILSNFTKTHLYHKVAQDLAVHGIQAFWIATNRKLYRFLLMHYPEHHVLLINRDLIKKPAEAIKDFKLNELIYGDRVLRYEAFRGLQYLTHIQYPVYEFLKKNNIKLVLGEITWAHEVLIHRMCRQCKELQCTFLNPHVVRIPDNRFAFFENERQSKLFGGFPKRDWSGSILQPQKPAYLKINDKKVKQASSFKGKLDRLKRYLSNENMDEKDSTLLHNSYWRLRTRGYEEWNRESYRWAKRISFEEVRGQPYAFLGLHKQPETSVDVFGRYYEDQLQNIRNIWRALPAGWNLLIKEHTNAIGDRPLQFYRELWKLPRVYVLHETTNSYEVMRDSKLVITITGTMAYEAALMQIPSVTFAPCFFNALNHCRQITLKDLQEYTLQDIAAQLLCQPDNKKEFSAFLYRHSFPGKVIDPLSDISVLDNENIRQVSYAIQLVADSLKISI